MKYILTFLSFAILMTGAFAQKSPSKKAVKDSAGVAKKHSSQVKKSASEAEEIHAAKMRKQPISKTKAPERLFLKDSLQ